MKLRIRKGLFSWKLQDENGTTLAKICSRKLVGSAKKIIDAKGNTIFTTDIVNLPKQTESWNRGDSRKYMIYKDTQPVATANLFFATNPERTKTQSFTLRPPKADKMEVESSYGIWVVQRQKNNGLNITHDDTSIGIISPFFSFKPVFLELSEKYEITFWASIYMLVEYMMHEDDFIVV
ncbi:hypothetical protein [Lacrimispora defluvii]|uniref:Uncharacterized protein n=1 Tax=Lacrimispora defluvii TaxID=2719233 RepID=A0ABX1VXB5_9FIRM|nr:hypothetical protein [Lacrimispora defluvii]NNJ30833.1 hypothetical protein [Lacrimispora defluvii]